MKIGLKLRIQLVWKISKIDAKNPKTSILQEPADLGGGELFGSPPPQDFDPLPTQRVPLFTIFRYSFVVIDHLAPIYTFLREGETPFLACFFFQNFACGADNLVKMESL